MQHVITTGLCYLTHYRTSSLSVAWFGAVCNALPLTTVKFIKKKLYQYFFNKNDGRSGNALQIVQNQETFRGNIW